jgi:hypothetical protein
LLSALRRSADPYTIAPLAMTFGSHAGSRNQPSRAAATGIAAGQRFGSSRSAASARLRVAATLTVDASPIQGTSANEPISEPRMEPRVFAV